MRQGKDTKTGEHPVTEDFSKIQTQWGSTARGFGSYSEDALKDLSRRVSTLCREITENTGILIFLSYGGLLGAQRNGRLIKHDFDIDVVFCSEKFNIEENCFKLCNYLISRNAALAVETNGQFKATMDIEGNTIKLEFFAGWISEGKFFQYFAVPGTVSEEDIFPLGEICLEGTKFPAPNKPIALLEAIYGKNWKVPDANFKYKLTKEDWKPFEFLFLSRMRDFWDGYYSKPTDQPVFSLDPSAFAIVVEKDLSSKDCIADFGCGNGRDSLYFAKKGHSVVSLDYSNSAVGYVSKIALSENLPLVAERLNVQSIPDTAQFIKNYFETFDVVYARFFTHAIDDIALNNFLKTAFKVARAGGRIYLEFRSRPDEIEESLYAKSLKYENGNHFRRLRSKTEMEERLEAVGFRLIESKIGKGMAVWKDEDPLVGRIIAEKF